MDIQTIKTYDQMAEEYDAETTVFWEIIPKTFIKAFQKEITGNVLDVGSGPGRDALVMQEYGIDVTCLDASESMIKMSQARGLKSIKGDFMNLPFDDQSFQGVWAYTSLLHVPKDQIDKALDEITRVLKPKGIFGLGMIEGDFNGYRESSGVNMPRWFSFYTKDELERLLKNHGFDIIYSESFKPKSKDYLNFIARKI